MSDERILRAGPLEVTFRDGDLWHIRLGRTELVERVYESAASGQAVRIQA